MHCKQFSEQRDARRSRHAIHFSACFRYVNVANQVKSFLKKAGRCNIDTFIGNDANIKPPTVIGRLLSVFSALNNEWMNLNRRAIFIWILTKSEVIIIIIINEFHRDKTSGPLSWPLVSWPFGDLARHNRSQWRNGNGNWSIDWVRLNVPPNTLQVISGTDFYGSNDQTNSVKALNEDRFKKLGFSPIRATPLCSQWYNNYAVWNKQKKHKIHTNTNKSTHSEMGPVRQNPIQRTVRTGNGGSCCRLYCDNTASLPPQLSWQRSRAMFNINKSDDCHVLNAHTEFVYCRLLNLPLVLLALYIVRDDKVTSSSSPLSQPPSVVNAINGDTDAGGNTWRSRHAIWHSGHADNARLQNSTYGFGGCHCYFCVCCSACVWRDRYSPQYGTAPPVTAHPFSGVSANALNKQLAVNPDIT